MAAFIERLNSNYFQGTINTQSSDPLTWKFSAPAENLEKAFYSKVIPSHLTLNMEYSLLGQRIRANLESQVYVDTNLVTEQIACAILLAELLEQVYQHYLVVPREVERLQTQKQIYRHLLEAITQNNFNEVAEKGALSEGFIQKVRLKTVSINLYRLLFVRSKRLLDLIATLDLQIEWYTSLMSKIDKHIDPFLPHLAWFFYAPRLAANLVFLVKHIAPGPWMGDKEKAIDLDVLLQGQLLRRWFELGNDLAWVSLGVANCLVFTGVLAPVAIYLTIIFFAFDVAMAAGRAYIELNRLLKLYKDYDVLKDGADGELAKEQIQALKAQIRFEKVRLGSHVTTTAIIFLASCCAAPFFMLTPIVPLIGAACLVLVCIANFIIFEINNRNRPQDMIAVPASGGIGRLSFFAQRAAAPPALPPVVDKPVEDYYRGSIVISAPNSQESLNSEEVINSPGLLDLEELLDFDNSAPTP